jgi:CRP/FNR family transcriptional regulator, cyclic AMP receptor protein
VPTDSLFLNAPVHRTVAAGEAIYREGDVGSHMYGIVSGEVTLHKGPVVVATLGPNDVFGERALIDHLPRNLTAMAAVETTLAEIDRSLFLFLVHESSTFALGIMGALAGRLRDYDELIGASGGDAAVSADPRRA